MDKQAFKYRMQNLKSYRENNPGKGYWDWKVEAFADGGVNDNLIGSYSNHTGTPTMYVPVTKEYEAVPEGFGEIANVHTPEVTITPQSNISLVEAVDKGRRDAAPYVGAIVAGATLPAMSSTNMLGKAIDLANIVLDPTNPANYVKIPNIRLGRWSAKFPEYGNQNKAFRQVNVDAVDDYINTGVVGPESKAHNAMRSAQNANKNSGGGSKHLLTLLTKHFDTHVMFNKTKPFYGKDSKYPRVLVGDLRNPRINWKKVNHKGHKNIVEPVDPSAGNFTVPIEEFDIWRKAKIGWLRDQKANRFADGGEVTRKSLRDIRKESTIEGKLDYDVMLQNQNAYQKEFATNWYKQRAKNPKYGPQLGDGKLDKILSDIDKATWKNPTEAMRDNLISQGYTPTDQNIKSQLQAINAKGTKGFAVPSMYSYYGAPRNTWHEGIGHIVGDNNPAILDSTPNISIPSDDPQYFDYVNQANEKHAQTWDFRGKNQTLKDDTGNYYIDPNRQLSSDDIQEMIDKGAVIPDQWKDITTQDISDLTNTFAYNYAEGGEVGNPDDDFTKAINTKLGRTPDGRPKEQGLKPVFDLENAANITPIGDALSARDVYNAVTEKDWTGAGLAALGILPFIPSGLRQLKPTARYIPFS